MLNFALWLQMIFCPYVTLDLWHCTMSLHVLGRDEANRKGLKCSQHSSFLSCVSFCQLQNIFPEKSASHQVHLSTGCVCQKLNQIFSRSPPPILSVAPFHGSTCRNLLLLFCLPGLEVSTVLRLILQLRAIKRSDPDSSPASTPSPENSDTCMFLRKCSLIYFRVQQSGPARPGVGQAAG